ncbi:unnamed protein product [Closterium sp. NIES-53]
MAEHIDVTSITTRSVGQPVSANSDGVVRNDGDDDHDTTHPEATNAARSQPRVTISVPADESTLQSPMPLKPHRPPCFDPSQRGGPTVQAWLFTLNVFFDANYVSEDTAKIRYAVPLLRGPAMDWWRVIKLRTWRQLGSVQDYTSGFLALCEQVGYMHESEHIDRYIDGLKHDIAQEIQLRGVTDFQEILAMAEKLDFFCRPRTGTATSASARPLNRIRTGGTPDNTARVPTDPARNGQTEQAAGLPSREGVHSHEFVTVRSTNIVHTEKRQGFSHVHRLPRTEQGYHQIPLPHPTN